MGCNACQKVLNIPGCTQTDDTTLLLNKIINADAVIYGSPLYGHSYSGQLKLFLDRHVALFKFVEGLYKSVDEMQIISFVENKPAMLLVSCMGPEENNADLIGMQFERFCESSLMKSLGTYVFPFCDHESKNTFIPEEKLSEIINQIKVS